MAIMYSYPSAQPALTDTIIGSKYYEEEGLVSRSFYISDIVNLVSSTSSFGTLQQVSDNGNTILVSNPRSKGIDITLSNLSTVYQAGVFVNIPSQTGTPYPTFNSSPDAYVAHINGQVPGTFPGSVGGYYVKALGADNVSFWSDHAAGTSLSYHNSFRNYDGVTSDFASYRQVITGVSNTEIYKVDYNGNVTANSFIKTGGLSTEFLKANGTTDSSTYIKSVYKNTTEVTGTGTTALTVLSYYQIPSNTFSVTDFISINAFFSKYNTNSTATTTIWLNSSPTLSGAVQIAQNNVTISSFASPMSRTFYLTGATLQGYSFTTNSATGTEATSTTIYSSTPYSTGGSMFIVFAMQLANANDTMILKGVRITN